VRQRSQSELLQRNEQLKALSTLGLNGGLALIAWGLGRWFLEGLDENVMVSLLVGSGIIWPGVKVLVLLEAEEACDERS
jgi:hypothetical protein